MFVFLLVVGEGGGSASGHGFVSGWLGEGGGGGGGLLWWYIEVVVGCAEVGGGSPFCSMLPLHGISERFLRFAVTGDRSLLRWALYWRLEHFFASAAQQPFLRF